MKKNYKARPIVSPSSFDAPVDIIIPYHGQYSKVTSLIESVYRCTRSNYITVTVMDDHSPNESFLSNMHRNAVKTAGSRNVENNFRAIRGTVQRGFAGASKVAFDRTDSPYVCFLNSDCLIEDGNWLRKLGETLLTLKDEGVRMVTPITNEPVGGHESQKGERHETSDDYVVLEGKEDYLTMYCFLCHRELFARCGGFLKEYPYGYYEDVEFAHRMRKNGFKQAVCRSSWVRHEGRATISTLWKRDPKIRTIMEEENHVRCKGDVNSL
jgi:GT2 family glycosyltransferase